ncbi:transposon TX1, partial [Tanacetum coccineum]
MNDFNDFIDITRLAEIPMGGRSFTRVSDDGMKFSKLDQFLLNEEFCNIWGNLSVVALDRNLSDHCPIVRDGTRTQLDQPDIGQVVEGAWNKEVKSKQPDCRFR